MVREYDSDFTEAHLKQYLAEAKTIQCLFVISLWCGRLIMLYVEEPYLDDTRAYEVAQSSFMRKHFGYFDNEVHIEDFAVKRISGQLTVITKVGDTQGSLGFTDMYCVQLR